MVNGLDRFREHFAAYPDRYVLIGGTASSVAMEELGEAFRVTKDLDIVLCVEALDRDFVEAFWEFVKSGGYENRQKSTGKRLFYRFYGPAKADFPSMLELFSRVPDALDLKDGAEFTPEAIRITVPLPPTTVNFFLIVLMNFCVGRMITPPEAGLALCCVAPRDILT